MHQAMLYEKLPNSRVRCSTCQWRCKIAQASLVSAEYTRTVTAPCVT